MAKHIFLSCLFFIATSSTVFAQQNMVEIMEWQQCSDTENMMCLQIPDFTVIQSSEEIGLYSPNLELLMVTKKHGVDTLNRMIGALGIAVSKKDVSTISILTKEMKDESNLPKTHLENTYFYSVILMVYLIIIFFGAISNDNFKALINPLKFTGITFNLTQKILISALISTMFGFFVTKEFFFIFASGIFIVLASKVIIGFFVDSAERKDYFIYPLFKIVNIIFVVFLALNLLLSQDVNIPISMDFMLYVLMVFFVLYGIRDAFLRFKKINLSYIFCYLCALEILPVLLLKEYYVI